MDIKLPGMSGLEILSRMHDSRMYLPVVICTAIKGVQDEFVVQLYPCLRVLNKPILRRRLSQLSGSLLLPLLEHPSAVCGNNAVPAILVSPYRYGVPK